MPPSATPSGSDIQTNTLTQGLRTWANRNDGPSGLWLV